MSETHASKKSSARAVVAVVPAASASAPVASRQSEQERLIYAAFSYNPLLKNNFFKSMETIMTQSKPQYDKIANEAVSASKENVEALIKSTNIWVKGAEDIMKTYMTLAQENASKNSEALKSLMACKTLNELTEVQNKLAQESFDGFMAGATKLSELTVKLTTDALEPINDQVSKSIKKVTESVAA